MAQRAGPQLDLPAPRPFDTAVAVLSTIVLFTAMLALDELLFEQLEFAPGIDRMEQRVGEEDRLVQDRHGQHRAQQEARPPTQLRSEHPLVEQHQAQHGAEGRADPEAAATSSAST